MTTERPADNMDALLAWLKEQALEVSRRDCTGCLMDHACSFDDVICPDEREHNTLNRVIAKIENSRVNQKPHLPQGWDEVD